MKRSLIVLLFISTISFSFRSNNFPSASKLSKSLVFPVAGTKSNIGSFWGDERDGGDRSHRGIDIFAKKGTPVVAITDGYISDRGTYPRGGKVIWFKSADHPMTAYYAHLDKWYVKEGQYVKKGQLLGTVGNTGNAKTTPPHLHFGLYTNKGAVNPLPYVKKAKKVSAPKIPVTKKVTAKKSTTKKAVAKKTSVAKKPVASKRSSGTRTKGVAKK